MNNIKRIVLTFIISILLLQCKKNNVENISKLEKEKNDCIVKMFEVMFIF